MKTWMKAAIAVAAAIVAIFAGVFVWILAQDADFTGDCGDWYD